LQKKGNNLGPKKKRGGQYFERGGDCGVTRQGGEGGGEQLAGGG